LLRGAGTEKAKLKWCPAKLNPAKF
jgi:hypothetical protein